MSKQRVGCEWEQTDKQRDKWMWRGERSGKQMWRGEQEWRGECEWTGKWRWRGKWMCEQMGQADVEGQEEG